MRDALQLPRGRRYALLNARVPAACLDLPPAAAAGLELDIDRLALVDLEVRDGALAAVVPAAGGATLPRPRARALDLRGRMVLPCFADVHTHIDKAHTCERSRNPDGSLSGADRSTAADAAFWDADDVERRMEFSLRCAYAHGTAALRTHLICMTPRQAALTWPAFSRLRARWAGRVELQGVALVPLSYFRDAAAAERLADAVAAHRGVLGAAVCCSVRGGLPDDEWTTCEADRDALLDRIFGLAAARRLDLDFHCDENGNPEARGLRHIARKALQHGFTGGRIVCGHCCSLAAQPPAEAAETLALCAAAGITIVSLPLVNQWTQDRSPAAAMEPSHALAGQPPQGQADAGLGGGSGGDPAWPLPPRPPLERGGDVGDAGDAAPSPRRTPRWRGLTLLHEAAAAGVRVCLASDNVRDQFYAYADLDVLEVFTQGCRAAHLDRPYGSWPAAVTRAPADAMRLPRVGRLAAGLEADFIIFPGARRYSELLARPHLDRLVVRSGRVIGARPPGYEELDFVPQAVRSGEVPVLEVGAYGAGGGARVRTLLGGAAAAAGGALVVARDAAAAAGRRDGGGAPWAWAAAAAVAAAAAAGALARAR